MGRAGLSVGVSVSSVAFTRALRAPLRGETGAAPDAPSSSGNSESLGFPSVRSWPSLADLIPTVRRRLDGDAGRGGDTSAGASGFTCNRASRCFVSTSRAFVISLEEGLASLVATDLLVAKRRVVRTDTDGPGSAQSAAGSALRLVISKRFEMISCILELTSAD